LRKWIFCSGENFMTENVCSSQAISCTSGKILSTPAHNFFLSYLLYCILVYSNCILWLSISRSVILYRCYVLRISGYPLSVIRCLHLNHWRWISVKKGGSGKAGAGNRPFPFWVKFWSRQVWTKISSQLERASQN
jgi:hypothetical protein